MLKSARSTELIHFKGYTKHAVYDKGNNMYKHVLMYKNKILELFILISF